MGLWPLSPPVRSNERLLRLMVENLPEGTWELVCHPGYNDADLRGIHTRLRESREQELRILTSPSTRDLLAANGIEIDFLPRVGGLQDDSPPLPAEPRTEYTRP